MHPTGMYSCFGIRISPDPPPPITYYYLHVMDSSDPIPVDVLVANMVATPFSPLLFQAQLEGDLWNLNPGNVGLTSKCLKVADLKGPRETPP